MVDLLIVYTPAARTQMGGTAAIEAELVGAVNNANTALANANVIHRFRLVHRAEIAYTESPQGSTDLERLTTNGEGFMDSAHTLRDTYGADVVTLLVSRPSFCGAGWLMGPSAVNSGFASWAFNVVDITCANANLTLAHEIGHNMGLHHDRANASSLPAFNYAYGYGFDGVGRTVMAYTCPGGACTKRTVFSTPLRNFPAFATPAGTVTEDNARALDGTSQVVAAFRPSASTPACTSFSIGPTSASPTSGAGSQSVTVTGSPAGCAGGSWTASGNGSWITVSPTSGTGSSAVTVSWAQNTSTSSRSGTATIAGSGFTVNQGGTAVTRIISLSTSQMVWGSVPLGSSASATLLIYSTGNASLTVSSISYPTGFGGNWSGVIPPGGTQAVTVTFAPTAATSYSGTATVNADQTSGTNTFTVSGTGAAVPPTVTTGAASGIGRDGATLNGTVNPNGASTTTSFDYGTTTAYGSSVSAQTLTGSNAQGISASPTLSCGQLYHFRAKGTNSGGTNYGADVTLTTSTCPLLAVNSTIVATGGTMTFTVANGPGNVFDWVGLYCPATGADGGFTDWKYLSNARTPPATGLTGAVVTFTAPTAGGTTCDARLFANNGFTKLATSATVTVINPVPTLTTLTPGTVPAGSVAFTLTVTGTNFVSTSVVQVNGAARTTTFVSATRVTAAIPSADVATPGANPPITVLNPAPGGGPSNSLTLTVGLPAPGPTVTVSSTTVAAGGTMTFTVANGPGNVFDWVGLYCPATGADGGYTDWKYLSNAKTPPTTGLSGAAVTFTAPIAGGTTCNARLFANNGFTKLATSATVTVTGPTLAVAPLTVNPGGTLTVTVGNGPGHARDWVGLFCPAAVSHVSFIDWKYLNGSRTPPAVGLTGATLTFAAPPKTGTCNVRWFVNDSYTLLATSDTVQVLALTTSHNPALTTQPPIFTATVSVGESIASGSVDFLDGSTLLGTAPIVCRNAVCAATFGGAMLTLADSPHVISASHDGQPVGSSVVQLVEEGIFAITDLGVQEDPRAGYGPHAINAAGDVVGRKDGTGTFLYRDGVMTDLGFGSGRYSINSAGHIAGADQGQALLSGGGIATVLGPCCTDVLNPPVLVNDAGQVAFSDGIHAFVYSDGVSTDLGDLGGGYSSAWGMNAWGQVVGVSTDMAQTLHAFVSDGGVMTDLGPLGNDALRPQINDAGQIAIGLSRINNAGQTMTGNVLGSGGVVTRLPAPLGALIAINNAAGRLGLDTSSADTLPFPTLYSGGESFDLNALIPADAGWRLLSATAINDRGQIIGSGIVAGETHAFLLTPVPRSAR
ncbi:MAG: M12 family metallo-peptidase [Acidobacteriota bacterium]|nr:M12 family metallo-peptidase [Acidobacteriota bacterium]